MAECLPDWPRASGPPSVTARLKTQAEDFRVDEQLTIDFSGDGEFDWLWVEKRELTTEAVARELARFADVPRGAVSWSGLKDKQALTRQWFSVHLPGRASPAWAALAGDRLRVLDSQRHRRKLRRATHRSNAFVIRLRTLEGDPGPLEHRLAALATQGVPNYFGEQRFGREGDNLRQVRDWFAGRGRAPKRQLRGLLLSTARAWLFNRYLARRVELAAWDRALPGDVLVLGDSNSLFRAEPDAALQARLAAGEIHPAGPLPGEVGNIAATGTAANLEAEIEAAEAALLQGLLAQRLTRAYRALRVIPRDVHWERAGQDLTLSFSLPAGCFATAVVRELVDIVSDSQR